MALNLFYITNRPDVALIAEKYGVDRIWIDLETLGKDERQKGMNTVKSNHKIEDIKRIKPLLKTAEMLVRVNPWHEGATSGNEGVDAEGRNTSADGVMSSVDEINAVIDAGADVIMLPMWKSAAEVQKFLSVVDHRCKTTLLLETKEAVECIDEVLLLDFDEIHIGLNDLHLSYGMTFMFELLADGTVERLCEKFKAKGIPYGFGGIARLGKGTMKAEKVIMEHYRLGSTRAILSRSFCDINLCQDMTEVENRFKKNMKPLRDFEEYCESADKATIEQNRLEVIESVEQIVAAMKEKDIYGT